MTSVETPHSSILTPPTAATLRDELQALVLADLLGPAGGPDEEVTDRHVRDRHLIGMLAPRGQHVEVEEQDELAAAGATGEGTADAPAAAAQGTLFGE